MNRLPGAGLRRDRLGVLFAGVVEAECGFQLPNGGGNGQPRRNGEKDVDMVGHSVQKSLQGLEARALATIGNEPRDSCSSNPSGEEKEENKVGRLFSISRITSAKKFM